jgi:glycosyltransferase involved in cell wall biosynthesis
MATSILMFCPQFRPIVGGAERQAEKLSESLTKKGVRVKILTPLLVAGTPEQEEDAGVTIRRFPLFDLCKRMPGIPGLGPMNLLLIRSQVIRAVNQYLGDASVLQTHIASPLSAFAMQAAKKRGIPVLCKAAMAGEKTDLRELSSIGIGGPHLAHSMVKHVDCWIATTQAVCASLLDWGVRKDRIALIPNGVEIPTSLPKKPNPPRIRRFLYLGRLSSNIQRDMATLIRAFDRLADRLPDAELALVGEGDLFVETAALVARTRNQERMRMPGLQNPEPWLQWADCFVLPSRREGLSNAMLEAMAHGLPCIANDIPPNRELLAEGRAGVLVPVGDDEELLSAMLCIAQDAAFVSSMSEAAIQRVKSRYSIDAIAEHYVRLYDVLIHSKTLPT